MRNRECGGLLRVQWGAVGHRGCAGMCWGAVGTLAVVCGRPVPPLWLRGSRLWPCDPPCTRTRGRGRAHGAQASSGSRGQWSPLWPRRRSPAWSRSGRCRRPGRGPAEASPCHTVLCPRQAAGRRAVSRSLETAQPAPGRAPHSAVGGARFCPQGSPASGGRSQPARPQAGAPCPGARWPGGGTPRTALRLSYCRQRQGFRPRGTPGPHRASAQGTAATAGLGPRLGRCWAVARCPRPRVTPRDPTALPDSASFPDTPGVPWPVPGRLGARAGLRVPGDWPGAQASLREGEQPGLEGPRWA